MAQDEHFQDMLEYIGGQDIIPLVKVLKGKENLSEFKLAEDLKCEVNYVRNMLYKLYDFSLVSFTRKKDKIKGWYIYYWTFNSEKVKDVMLKIEKERLERLERRLEAENSGFFFECQNRCIRLGFEQATDFEYRCPECGELVNQQNNEEFIKNMKHKIKDTKDRISALEKEIRDDQDAKAEIERKKDEEEHKKLEKKRKEEEAKEKAREEKRKRIEEKKLAMKNKEKTKQKLEKSVAKKSKISKVSKVSKLKSFSKPLPKSKVSVNKKAAGSKTVSKVVKKETVRQKIMKKIAEKKGLKKDTKDKKSSKKTQKKVLPPPKKSISHKIAKKSKGRR